MEEFLQSISASSGFPVDQLKYLACLLLLAPLAVPFRALHNVTLKHLYSVIVSFLMLWFCLSAESFAHSFGTSLVCYLILLYVPHKHAYKVVFAWMMGYMFASHLYRIWTDWMGWSLDFTGPQMVLTIKMTTLAINYFDGNEPAQAKEKMRPFQKEHMIEKLPSLLEFFGFVYFFPSFLAGPAIEIKDYLRFIDGTLVPEKDNHHIPWIPLLKTYRKALLVLPIVVLSVAVLPVSTLTAPEFALRPFLMRALLMHLVVSFARHKYYFAWYLAETGFVASGFSYNGRDAKGAIKWDRATNGYPLKVEFPENIRGCVENWNIVTQTWLRNYIYLRMADVGFSTAPCTIATYTISAFWHGLYPGYYFSFVTAALVTEVAKSVRRKIRPLFMQKDGVTPKQPYKYIYDIVGVVLAGFTMNYTGLSFVLLILPPSFHVYGLLYYCIHVGTAVVFVLLQVMPTPKNQPPRGGAQ